MAHHYIYWIQANTLCAESVHFFDSLVAVGWTQRRVWKTGFAEPENKEICVCRDNKAGQPEGVALKTKQTVGLTKLICDITAYSKILVLHVPSDIQ